MNLEELETISISSTIPSPIIFISNKISIIFGIISSLFESFIF